MTKHNVPPPSSTCYPRFPRTRTKLVCAEVTAPSVQLKIEFHSRNNFDLLAINPSRFCPALLHGRDGGISEHRFALEKLQHFDAAILCYSDLKFYDSLNPGALRKNGIGGVWRIEEPLLEIVRVLAESAGERDFHFVEPAFEPVALGRRGLWRVGCAHLWFAVKVSLEYNSGQRPVNPLPLFPYE